MSLLALAASPAAGQVVAGDVNGSGVVDAQDFVDLAVEIFDGDGDDAANVGGGAFPGAAGADANGDGRITGADFTWVTLAQPGFTPPPTSTARPPTSTRTATRTATARGTPTPTPSPPPPTATPTSTQCRAQALVPGSAIGGSLGLGDCTNHGTGGRFGDVYTVAANPGQAIRVQVNSSDFVPEIIVHDAGGYFGESRVSPVTEFLVTTTRPYEVVVTARSFGAAVGNYSVTTSVRNCPTPRAAVPTRNGARLSGNLTDADCPDPASPAEPADQFTFSVCKSGACGRDEVPAGSAVSVLVAVTSDDSTVDPFVEIYGPTQPGALTGFVLGSDDDSGGGLTLVDAKLALYAYDNGIYTLVVHGGPGPYTITFSLPDCPATSTALAHDPVMMAGTLSDTSCPAPLRLPGATKGDPNSPANVWRISADAGDVIAALMISSDFDAQLYLFGPDLTLLAADDDDAETGGSDAQLAFTVPHAGTYTLVAASNDAFTLDGSTGDYMLQLQKCPASLISTDLATSESFVDSDCHGAQGALVDSYRFNGSAGEFLTATMVADPASDINAVLTLTDPSGHTLTNDDDPFLQGAGTDSRLSRMLPETGAYFLSASSSVNDGEVTGGYAVVVQHCRTIPATVGTVNGEFRDDDCELAGDDTGSGAKLNVITIPTNPNQTLSVVPPDVAACALAVTPDGLQGPGSENCFSDYFIVPLAQAGTTVLMLAAPDSLARDSYSFTVRSCPTSLITYGASTGGFIRDSDCRDATGVLGDFYLFRAPAPLTRFSSGVTGILSSIFSGGSIAVDNTGVTTVVGSIGENAGDMLPYGSDLGVGLEVRARDPNVRGEYTLDINSALFHQ